MKLKVLDLFSGIGGFSLGLERTGGFETVAFCEIEDFPRRVLAKHWPSVLCYRDVRELTAERLAADGIAVDVICGGFPCQDISTAGKGAGLAGERSGLWSEIARLVGELRPRYVIVENVSALLGRGLGTVLGDLAEIGYDAEWHCIPASHVGAPHRRDRIWIVAYPALMQCNGRNDNTAIGMESKSPTKLGNGCGAETLANATGQRQQGQGQPIQWGSEAPHGEGQTNKPLPIRLGGIWPTEPNVGRVANGIPDRSHRLKGLGNAVVPHIPELIGNAILSAIGINVK
jgi:DNA (cytosine-5)-methyltransferase 1